jgi:outer membrane immunogenic protein
MTALSTHLIKTAVIGAALMASVSLASMASRAADLEGPGPVSDPWTGFYIGAQVGYLQGIIDDRNFCFDDGFCATDDGYSFKDLNPDGVTVGGYAGYNFRMDNLLLGLEGDINWDTAKDSNFECCFFADDVVDVELNWHASIRARLGMIVDESALFYITGGPSWISEEVSIGSESYFGDSSDSTTNFGWQLGAGAEYFVTDHLSTKLEYLHGWYGDEKFLHSACGFCFLENDLETNIVRAGVAYHFR